MNYVRLFIVSALSSITVGCQINKAVPDPLDLIEEPQVDVVAGSPTGYGYRDGVADSAKFRLITSMTFDASGDLYVTDNINELIRVVSLQKRQVATVAGRVPASNYVYQGDKDGPSGVAELLRSRGITADGAGKFYVIDSYRGRIRQITADGRVSTLGGTPFSNSVLFRNGPLREAVFFNAWDMVLDKMGNLYVADLSNACIRKISPDQTVSTFAGTPRVFGYKDGRSDSAVFNAPWALTLDAQGNLFVAENEQPRVRKITPTGEVSTLAGGGADGITAGYQDGPGKMALFGSKLTAIACDPAGNLYVSDTYNGVVRKITPEGAVSTVVGKKTAVPYSNASPQISGTINALAFDKAGTLYVATEQTIYRIKLD